MAMDTRMYDLCLIWTGARRFAVRVTGQLSDVLVAAYGVDDIKQMVPVDATTGGIRVTGFASGADLWRTDRNRISVFVNGRVVQDNNLTYAVTQAYQTLFQAGQYPVAALMIQLPPEDVDVKYAIPTKVKCDFVNQVLYSWQFSVPSDKGEVEQVPEPIISRTTATTRSGFAVSSPAVTRNAAGPG